MTLPSDQFTSVLGLSTRYWEVGSGEETLLLIHGISCSVMEWQHVVADLARHHRVFALDLPGHGLTDKPADASYDIAMFADFTLAFMKAMGIGSAHLVGNSLGGRIAIECAAIAPDRVTCLVLSAPAAVDNPTLVNFRVASLPFVGELLTKPNPAGTGMVWRTAVADPKVVTAGLVAQKVALAKMPGAQQAFLKGLRAMMGFSGFKAAVLKDTHEKIRAIKAPALVIWGDKDRFLPVSHLSTFMRLMPQAQPITLKHCGHVPMVEYPEKFSELVLNFVGNPSARNQART